MKMKLQMEATKQPLNWFRLDYNTRFPTAPYDYNMSLRKLDVRLVFFSDRDRFPLIALAVLYHHLSSCPTHVLFNLFIRRKLLKGQD